VPDRAQARNAGGLPVVPLVGKDQPGLKSFAAITGEPLTEIATAGHQRCMVTLKPEHIDASLNSSGRLGGLRAILDTGDRLRQQSSKHATATTAGRQKRQRRAMGGKCICPSTNSSIANVALVA
jgi:hypothetical protein